MNNTAWQKLKPHVIAIAVFFVVSSLYSLPAYKDMVLNQSDIKGYTGMAQESVEYKEKNGHYPLWTNSMFSGMPAYLIVGDSKNPVSIGYLHNYIFTLGLPKPVNFFFLACIMAYFLLQVMGVKPLIGVFGAIAYAYSTYDPILVATGHDTKMICIGYAPAVLGSILLLFQKKYIAGTALTTLFGAMIIWQNHIQVVYYLLLVILTCSIAFLIRAIRSKETRHVIIVGSLALVSAIIAVSVNAINLWPMNEYAKESMRGGRSELTDSTQANNKTVGGLDKEYAFRWSYGIPETLTFIAPGIYGGSNGGDEYSENAAFVQKLGEVGIPEENAVQMANGYSYWGTQPNTSGPVYLGAVICFLFIFGMVYLKSWHKWWILVATIIGILLAWGRNLPELNYFLFDHLPLYNKFRAPSMSLIIPQLTFPVLACLTLQQLLFGNDKKEELWKKFKLTLYITGGIFAILLMLYFSFSYHSQKDNILRQNFTNGLTQQMSRGQQPTPQMQQQADQLSRSLVDALEEDRQSLFGKDIFRSFIFIALSAGLIGMYLKNKLKPVYVMIGVLLLSSIDLLAVDTRYLNHDNFITPEDFDAAFIPTQADQTILADPEKNFRVFDQTGGDPYSDSRPSYFHNSIAGYHPAKLDLYNDLITHQLSKGNMNVFNMLNTKYFIVQNPATGQPVARYNPGTLGNCWFVQNIVYAQNANEEMSILDTLDTENSAVVDVRFKDVAGGQPRYDSTATIKLDENRNDTLVYSSSSQTDQFAVFSEVYYPHGWKVYLDGKEANYCRVNYVLRGMPVPAGNHTIEFRFRPASVITGDKITTALSILIYLMLIGAAIIIFRKKQVV